VVEVVKKHDLLGKPQPVEPAKERVTDDHRRRAVEDRGVAKERATVEVKGVVESKPVMSKGVMAEVPVVTKPMGSKVVTVVVEMPVVTKPAGSEVMAAEMVRAAKPTKMMPKPRV